MPSFRSRFVHPISRLVQRALGTAHKSFVEQREAGNRLAAWMPTPRDVSFIFPELKGLPCMWAVPKAPISDSIIYFLHGGGYVSGTLPMYQAFTANLASATGLRVFTLEYRLAPEHPYPAALEDALIGYQHFLDAGVRSGSIVIAGDSAGGGLLVALAQHLVLQDELLPAALVCLSPWTDLTMSGTTIQTLKDKDPVLTLEWLQLAADAYLGERDHKTHGASPLYGKMAGLPPTLIQVGDDEILRDDAVRLHARMRKANVDAQLEVWPSMVHGWHMLGTWLPETRRALQHVSDFIQKYA